MKYEEVYVALGSNLGDRLGYINEAINRLKIIETVKDLEVSNYYQTVPVSDVPQGLYINAVCRMKLSIQPLELLKKLKQIENDLGRIRTVKNGPRTIDLDILLYGKIFVDLENLTIPHKRFKERLFVMKPLSDLVDFIEVPNNEDKLELLDIKNYLKNFPNIHRETVIPLERNEEI